MAQKPTMKKWTEIWHQADAEGFKNMYAQDALIFPPHKPTIQGNTQILEFMKGGMGKVDVFFEVKKMEVNEKLAFEYGIFKDVELDTQKVIVKGKYFITWVLIDSMWKIQCHTWSMPEKD